MSRSLVETGIWNDKFTCQKSKSELHVLYPTAMCHPPRQDIVIYDAAPSAGGVANVESGRRFAVHL
jgi:hypothetical protein